MMRLGTYKHIVFSWTAGGLLLAGLFLLLNATPPVARAVLGDRFVTPGGGGDCSQGHPCELQAALSQAMDSEF